MTTKKINIKEIAEKAGVSVATISRAINPETRKKVAPHTLEKIDALIRQYKYVPNLAAKQLRKSATNTIGVIFPYDHNIFYSSYHTHVLSGIANCLLDTQYQLKLLLVREEKQKLDGYDFKAGERVDGLILSHWARFFSNSFISKEMNLPCVIINDFNPAVKARFIGGDHVAGGKLAAEHLYSLGHRHIGLITGPSWSNDSKQRVEGFKAYLNSAGVQLSPECVGHGDYSDDQKTYAIVDELIQKKPMVTAIFACNDHMAFAAIKRLREHGIKCPEEISVIGYDDDFRAESFNPPLTTIKMPIYDIAFEAARALSNYLEQRPNQSPFVGVTLLPVELVERSTVGKIN